MYFFSIALRKEVFKSRMLSLSVPLTLQRDFKRKSLGQTSGDVGTLSRETCTVAV